MTFAAIPWWIVGLLGAAVAALVIALYLLRRTPKPAIVSSLAFWIEAVQRARPRLLASTRIPLLSLLVSLLVALLLVVAIGEPRFGEGVRGTTVLVISAGRSMGAEEAGRTRLARALDDARLWSGRATASGEVAVVRAGIRPSVLVPCTDDEGAVDDALSAFSIDDGPADLEAAVALADDVVAHQGGAGQILVLADTHYSHPPTPARVLPGGDPRTPLGASQGSASGSLRSQPVTRAPTVVVPVGAQADTLAVSRLVARRDPIAVGEYAVEAEVRSFTSRRARARLVVRDRDVPILDQVVSLGPLEAMTVRGQGFSSAQAELVAQISEIEIAGSEDALAADDVAYAVAAPLDTVHVLLATDGASFLERVLEAHPAVEARRVGLGQLRSLDLASYDVVIVEGGAPVDHPGLLLVDPVDDPALGVERRLDAPRVTATLASHRALGGVRLESARIASAHALDAARGDRVLVRSGPDALAIAREGAGGRMVALGFALEDTDLVEQAAFPLLVHHTLRWLATREPAPPLPGEPGDVLSVGIASTVLGPDHEPRDVHGGLVDDTERAGIYQAVSERSGGAGRAVAADDQRAFAISGAQSSSALSGTGITSATARTSVLPPLALLVAAALLFLVLLEWALLHRGRLS